MATRQEKKAERLSITRPAAVAFAEDMMHVREVAQRAETSRGELRRLSSIARRLLVDGEIEAVAGPRIGRLLISMPDHSTVYEAEKRGATVLAFASGGPRVFGYGFSMHAEYNLGQPRPGETPQATMKRFFGTEAGPHYDPTVTVKVRLQNFLRQRVLCRDGMWVTRSEAIRYVAHVLSGVHSREPKEPYEAVCAAIQATTSLKLEQDGRLHVSIRKDLGPNGAAFHMDKKEGEPRLTGLDLSAVDPVLIEVLAALQYVTESDDVLRLEASIREETKTQHL